ncbi:hypothetical protein I3843_13G073500 [Carya illinoinensis]|uniref:Uncharacterized protein n=1 Tax=Carya illinoinensis TaxID=32201 RepID=A0A922AGL7_CARIL|nr:uncharacterized protein LOC122292006 isoform X1 [Carya illinoinensis]KAG2673332.1 hypothetical protein I3760_13G086000 [Carya illinoinensis]KAG6681293.1 hypothetical protein I3842_13G086100 [Carya illinoinensis]KAG7949645.1 hypothetical protein I3843_13G073500 [Carya illinoinensis]
MENKKQGCSPSSITADLFGAKESSPTSSAGTFASIFPPPSKLIGKNSSSTEVIGSWQKQHSENQTWNMKQGTPAIGSDGAHCSIANKDRSSIFQEERVEPCHLSSSLYYGGQDIYSQSPSTQSSGSYPLFKQNVGEDEPNGNNSNSASRGNWWQGIHLSLI